MNTNKLKHYADRIKQEARGLDRVIIARLAGVTFEGRQEYLAKMSSTTEVRLERDRRNQYDFNAVKIMAYFKKDDLWEHVGFIPSTMSKLIATSLDNGVELSTVVHRVTGGMVTESGDQLNFGLEVKILPPQH